MSLKFYICFPFSRLRGYFRSSLQNQSGSENLDAGLFRRSVERVVAGGQRQLLPEGELQVGCIINGEVVLLRKIRLLGECRPANS